MLKRLTCLLYWLTWTLGFESIASLFSLLVINISVKRLCSLHPLPEWWSWMWMLVFTNDNASIAVVERLFWSHFAMLVEVLQYHGPLHSCGTRSCLGSNALPTKTNLASRFGMESLLCPLCHLEDESYLFGLGLTGAYILRDYHWLVVLTFWSLLLIHLLVLLALWI